MRCLAEVYHDFSHLGRHLFSGTYIERNAAPPPVVNAYFHGNISFGTGIGSYVLLFTITGLGRRRGILPTDNVLVQVFFCQGRERFIYFYHLVAEIIGIENCRRFHRGKRYQLNEVILYHITQCSGSFIKPSTLFDTQILYCGNLYIVNVITVPKRLEDAIGKTKSQNVLRSLFTQEMVYTVNLMLLEYGSIDTVQFTGRFQIITERLLDDDTRMRTVQAGSLKMKRNHTIQRRRCCQIVQHAIRLLLTRQFPETGIQISIIGSLGRIKRKIVQMIAKISHTSAGMFFRSHKTFHFRPYISTVGIIPVSGTSDA